MLGPAYVRRASLLLSLLCACGNAAAPPPSNMNPRNDGGGTVPGPDGPPSDDPCAQVRCADPPSNTCTGGMSKTYYDPNGSCSAGVCTYRFTTQTCRRGCAGDHCAPESGDAGPDSPAVDTATSCSQSSCTTPPANECDGTTLKTYYDPNGTCAAGVCSYRFSTQSCPGSCLDGRCLAAFNPDGGPGTGPDGPGGGGNTCQPQTCPGGCKDGVCLVDTCKPGRAVFTADVTDVASLATVGTLPALAGGAAYEIRSYMQVKDSYLGMQVPIYAPTDMTLIVAVHYKDPLHDPSDTAYDGEWGLTFDASCTTQVGFAHVRKVVKKISDVAVTAPGGASGGGPVSKKVDFAAGEVIGYYVRGPGFFAWDFIVTDTSRTNTFINMPRYQDAQHKLLYAICPYDLYQQPMRQRYLDLLGTSNDPPVAGRLCGTVAHDKAGTAAGVWFHVPYVSGTADQARSATANPLSLFKSEAGNVFVANLEGKIDNAGFLTFRIEPTNPTHRDPATITASHCYERRVSPSDPATGWAFVKVVSNTELQIAYSTQGACPSTFPTTGARTYYR